MKQELYSGYEEIPHTADLAIRVWSDGWPGLVVECFHATRDLLGYSNPDVQETQIPFKVHGTDRLTTLISFLNEMLFQFEQGKLPVDVQLLDIQDGTLGGIFSVKAIANVYHQVKAVTFHGGNIQESHSELSVIVVYDL